MKSLVLTMLLTIILSSCRNGANINLSHTEKSYSPVFVYLPDGHIDVERSYCITSSQHFSISGHEFLDAKVREPISVCDRAIGYKGSSVYDFFNKAAFEIRKGAGLQSRKSNEVTGSKDSGEVIKQHYFGEADRVRY